MLWTLPTALPDNDTGAFTLAFSPRSPFLVAGTALGVASVWTLKDPFRPRLLTTNTAKPSPTEVETGPAIALSPDGRILAGGSKLTVGLWNATDLPRLTPLGKPLTGHTATLQAVRFSPDGHTLASLDRRGTLRLWDVTDPRHARPLSSPCPVNPRRTMRWPSARTGGRWLPPAVCITSGCGTSQIRHARGTAKS